MTFDGGPQIDTNSESLPGDLLVIYAPSNETADSVVHRLAPASIPANGFDGSIEISDASTGVATTITYTGVEPVIDHLTVVDRSFEFDADSEIVTLRDDLTAANGYTQLGSTLAATVTFRNPSNSLSIDTKTGNGGDTIHSEGVDSQFNADLIITGDGVSGEEDTVTFQTNATNIGTGNLRIDSGGAVTKRRR